MLTLAIAFAAAAPAAAQTPAPPAPVQSVQPAPQLRARAGELVALLNGGGDYDGYFHAAFKAAIARPQFDAIGANLRGAIGKAVRIETLTATSPWQAKLRIAFERGVLNADIAVDPNAPHTVTGLRAHGTEATEVSIDAVAQAIASLPGRTGFALATLGDGAPSLDVAHQATTPLAIGSAFKLVILAELVRATNAGERRWSDVVTLAGTDLPGGRYTMEPKGTQVALRELAEAMISVSDNSATDILLFHLGREKVEAMLPVVGMTDGAARNRPFLGTLEMFKLKGITGFADRWQAADEAGRRAMLAGDVAAAPMLLVPATLFQDRVPVRIEQIEWFASPADLVRTMDWLRRNTEGPNGADARAVLSRNSGLGPVAGKWGWVGFKGGSEPGVLNLTYLLHGRDGGWRVLTGSWNDPDKSVDDTRFMGLMARAADLAATAERPD